MSLRIGNKKLNQRPNAVADGPFLPSSGTRPPTGSFRKSRRRASTADMQSSDHTAFPRPLNMTLSCTRTSLSRESELLPRHGDLALPALLPHQQPLLVLRLQRRPGPP